MPFVHICFSYLPCNFLPFSLLEYGRHHIFCILICLIKILPIGALGHVTQLGFRAIYIYTHTNQWNTCRDLPAIYPTNFLPISTAYSYRGCMHLYMKKETQLCNHKLINLSLLPSFLPSLNLASWNPILRLINFSFTHLLPYFRGAGTMMFF